MKQWHSATKRCALWAAACVVFVLFFNGYSNQAPSRGKFKRLGEGEVDLTAGPAEEEEEVDLFADVVHDKRFKAWASWWRVCAPGFSTETLDDIGLQVMNSEQIAPLTAEDMQGPRKQFFTRSPDGKRLLNPYWQRLTYEKLSDGWQGSVNIRCGAALYDSSTKQGRNILECSALEGIDDAFWKGRDRVVLMGYESVTREMNVECTSVESCVSPVVWIVDLKNNRINQRRGPVLQRKACELGGYLKVKLPKFFAEDKPKS